MGGTADDHSGIDFVVSRSPGARISLKSDRSFQTRRIPEYSRRDSAAIVKAQNELAFRKWRVKQLGQAIETDPLVLSWREQLIRLRGSEALAVS